MEVQRKLVGSTGDGGSWVTVQAKRVAPEGPLTVSSDLSFLLLSIVLFVGRVGLSTCRKFVGRGRLVIGSGCRSGFLVLIDQVGAPHCAERFNSRNGHTVSNNLG